MKKTLLVAAMASTMGLATSADAAVTGMVDGTYAMTITSGCFAFGDCQNNLPVTGGTLTDNTTQNQADTSGFGLPNGSGVINDGIMGFMDFTISGGVISNVTRYGQDSYLNTAGGTFYVRALDLNTMGGTIDQTSGAMTFDPTGRAGLAANFLTDLGEQEWNRDNTADNLGTGAYDQWTTASSSNRQQGLGAGFTITGSDFIDAAISTWTGKLVSAGNIGQAWGGFNNQQYSEIFDMKLLLVDPVANDDPITTSVNTPKLITVASLLDNDTHALNEVLSLDSFSQPGSASTVVDNGDNTLTYTPDAALGNGDVDSFTYIISDATGRLSPPATVSVTITSNAAPTAVPDDVTTAEDTPLTYDPVANDTDPTGEALSLSSFTPFSLEGGAVVAATGDAVTYTPAANFNGTDTFNYQVTDGINVVTGLVTITVTPVNDAPVCSDVGLSTGVNLPLEINVANDLLLTTTADPLCTDEEGEAVSLATFDATGDKGGTLATGLTFGGTNDVEFVWDETSFNDTAVNSNGIPTDTNFTIMQISSPFPFFNANWFAHNVRIFKNTTGTEITLNFDISCAKSDYEDAVGTVDCGGTKYIKLTLQDGEIGAHILFDWGETGKNTPCGQAACDIDVVNKWDQNAQWTDTDGPTTGTNNLWLGAKGIAPAIDATWTLVSIDANGDGINGTPMLDGPFLTNYANFNYKPSGAGESLPPFTGNIDDVNVDSLAFSMGWWSLLAGLLPVFGLRRINNKK